MTKNYCNQTFSRREILSLLFSTSILNSTAFALPSTEKSKQDNSTKEYKKTMLSRYLSSLPDPTWNIIATETSNKIKKYKFNLNSQRWQNIDWKHSCYLYIPNEVFENRAQNQAISTWLYLTSSENNGSISFCTELASLSNMPVIMLSDIPNQPLFDNLREDRLLAYTLKNYLESGDESWPIIFPMVGAAHQVIAISKKLLESEGISSNRYLLTGSSKRGWTAWLAGLTHPLCIGIAPAAFEMINIPQQSQHMQNCYGVHSHKLSEYSESKLFAQLNDPKLQPLLEAIDPYYLAKNTEKRVLIVQGTNDPYWTVDSHRFYFDDLKRANIFSIIGGGHHVLKSPYTLNNLAAWGRIVSTNEDLPKPRITITEDGKKLHIGVHSYSECQKITIYNAFSSIRDFRDSGWFSISNTNQTYLTKNQEGYQAFSARCQYVSKSLKSKLDLYAPCVVYARNT